MLRQWVGRTASAGVSVVSKRNDGVYAEQQLERTRSSTRYLLAKCCYDLGFYGEAEEALLRHVREKFSRVVASGGKVGCVKMKGNMNEAMDAWILQTTVSCK